jgi:hypothetical protein
MSLFVNVYYFDSDEEFRLQDASFTEIKIQHNGSKIKDFDVDIKNIEKLIRINRSNGNNRVIPSGFYDDLDKFM